MTTKDLVLDDKTHDVLKAISSLNDETTKLGDINDEPSIKQEEVQGVLAFVIKLVASLVKP